MYFKAIDIKCNLQMLRDTAATLRQLAGQFLEAVSSLLGHSNQSVALKYYTDKDQVRGLVAGVLNLTNDDEIISNTFSPEAIGKNGISNDFQQVSSKQKTPQKKEFLDDKTVVTPARLERATNGLKGHCSTN